MCSGPQHSTFWCKAPRHLAVLFDWPMVTLNSVQNQCLVHFRVVVRSSVGELFGVFDEDVSDRLQIYVPWPLLAVSVVSGCLLLLCPFWQHGTKICKESKYRFQLAITVSCKPVFSQFLPLTSILCTPWSFSYWGHGCKRCDFWIPLDRSWHSQSMAAAPQAGGVDDFHNPVAKTGTRNLWWYVGGCCAFRYMYQQSVFIIIDQCICFRS